MNIREALPFERELKKTAVITEEVLENAEVQKKVGNKARMQEDAILLTEALRVAQNTPDTRAEKIAELRAKVASGTYEINSLNIALALTKEEMDFLI